MVVVGLAWSSDLTRSFGGCPIGASEEVFESEEGDSGGSWRDCALSSSRAVRDSVSDGGGALAAREVADSSLDERPTGAIPPLSSHGGDAGTSCPGEGVTRMGS